MNDQERKELRAATYLTPEYKQWVAENIGEQIAKQRTAAGMTPEQIEQATGYKASAIRAHERGAYAPKTVTQLCAIAAAMQCHIEIVKN